MYLLYIGPTVLATVCFIWLSCYDSKSPERCSYRNNLFHRKLKQLSTFGTHPTRLISNVVGRDYDPVSAMQNEVITRNDTVNMAVDCVRKRHRPFSLSVSSDFLEQHGVRGIVRSPRATLSSSTNHCQYNNTLRTPSLQFVIRIDYSDAPFFPCLQDWRCPLVSINGTHRLHLCCVHPTVRTECTSVVPIW